MDKTKGYQLSPYAFPSFSTNLITIPNINPHQCSNARQHMHNWAGLE